MFDSLTDPPAFALLGIFALPIGAGLLSGVSHCAAMCGPIHLFLARQGGRGLWVYHAGRLGTYVLLGALAGLVGATLRFPGSAWLWVAVYLVLGLRMLGVSLWPASWGAGYGAWMLARLRPLTTRSGGGGTPLSLFPLGLAAGLLPCVTTQAGFAWAAASSSPAIGASGMLLLGAGTLPLFLAWPHRWFPAEGSWHHAALGFVLLALAFWKLGGLLAAAPICH